VWREVVELGSALKRLAPVRGSRVESRAAIVFDYEAWWASEIDSKPSQDVKYLDVLRAFYRSLFLRGISVDIVHPSASLEGYDLVLVCTLYLVTDQAADNIAAAAHGGATVLVSYIRGITDEKDHVRPGGYPGAFRDSWTWKPCGPSVSYPPGRVFLWKLLGFSARGRTAVPPCPAGLILLLGAHAASGRSTAVLG
jgi:beta-galactosidase GanA